MKPLTQYFNELNETTGESSPVNNQEVDTMRKMKIITQTSIDETEGLYNTTDDRWSRRAKHQLSKNDLINSVEQSDFAKGEYAVYEGQQVEVRIPIGPNGTAGVMLEGHLRMVERSKLTRLDEGVMGGMQPLNPLNRIMQLAGLEHSGAVVEVNSGENTLEEADATGGTMLNQLLKKNSQDRQYSDKKGAPEIVTIGQVLSSMQSLVASIEAMSKDPNITIPTVVLTRLKTIPALGVSLMNTAKSMQTTTTTTKTGAEE